MDDKHQYKIIWKQKDYLLWFVTMPAAVDNHIVWMHFFLMLFLKRDKECSL